jgi:ClpP class serine protease
MTARTSGLPSVRASSLLLGENAETRVTRAGTTAEPPAQEWGANRLEVADERHERDERGAEGGCGKRFCRQLPHRGGGDRRAGGQRDRRPDHREQGDENARGNESQESHSCHGPEETSSGEPDDRNARRDPETGGDAEQIPVEHSVHEASVATASRRISSARVDLGNIFTILLFAAILLPVLQRRALEMRRVRGLNALERARGTRVIAMIHRQETVGFLGVPLFRFIDIDDSEAVLRAIRLTPDDRPIDLLLHTPGGLVLASEQIAYALREHPAEVTVLVPHYAMSGGTLLALAADEILMDTAAVLGPVDPQLGDMPAASIVRVAQKKPVENLDDRTLLLADVAEKALRHMKQVVTLLVTPRLDPKKAESLAEELAGGHYTHDDPITFTEAQQLGLPVQAGLPEEAYALMELFPQAGRRRPSVQYVPLGEPEQLPRDRQRP